MPSPTSSQQHHHHHGHHLAASASRGCSVHADSLTPRTFRNAPPPARIRVPPHQSGNVGKAHGVPMHPVGSAPQTPRSRLASLLPRLASSDTASGKRTRSPDLDGRSTRGRCGTALEPLAGATSLSEVVARGPSSAMDEIELFDCLPEGNDVAAGPATPCCRHINEDVVGDSSGVQAPPCTTASPVAFADQSTETVPPLSRSAWTQTRSLVVLSAAQPSAALSTDTPNGPTAGCVATSSHDHNRPPHHHYDAQAQRLILLQLSELLAALLACA